MALPLFLVAFALFWCAICFLISLFGWRRVAAAYPDQVLPGAASLRFRSGYLGGRYRNCLRFDVSPYGLRVSVLPLFRVGHRPFFVPWSEVSVERTRRVFSELWAFRFAARPATPLLVWPSLGQQLLELGRGAAAVTPR